MVLKQGIDSYCISPSNLDLLGLGRMIVIVGYSSISRMMRGGKALTEERGWIQYELTCGDSLWTLVYAYLAGTKARIKLPIAENIT